MLYSRVNLFNNWLLYCMYVCMYTCQLDQDLYWKINSWQILMAAMKIFCWTDVHRYFRLERSSVTAGELRPFLLPTIQSNDSNMSLLGLLISGLPLMVFHVLSSSLFNHVSNLSSIWLVNCDIFTNRVLMRKHRPLQVYGYNTIWLSEKIYTFFFHIPECSTNYAKSSSNFSCDTRLI